ncbi:MAG: sulfotransferase [Anaerolineales bacterium]|nr:sulfotransferase [Anaerolineales bacterium]
MKNPFKLNEEKLDGVSHGYSLAASGSMRLLNSVAQWPEKLLLWPLYGLRKIDRPIFVVGPFRSGTTILEKIIGDHPDVGHFTYMSNVYFQAPITGYILMNILWRIGFLDQQILSAVHNPRVKYTMFSPYECEWIWSQTRRGLWAPDVKDISLGVDYSDPEFESYLRSMIKRHMLFQRSRRFLSKNPVSCLRLDYLHKLFPDARFVTIVRNPLDTVLSHYRMSSHMEKVFYQNPQTKWILQEGLHMDLLSMRIKTPSYDRTMDLNQEHALLSLANQWADLETAVLDSVKNNEELAAHSLQLTYEDFVNDSRRVLNTLWDFTGLDGEAADQLTEKYKDILTPPEPLELTQEEKALLPRVLEIMKPAAERAGYQLD